MELIQQLCACLDPSLWGGSLSGCLESVFPLVPKYGNLAKWDKWKENPAAVPLECLLCPLHEAGTRTLWPKRREYIPLPSVTPMRPWKAFQFGNFCLPYRLVNGGGGTGITIRQGVVYYAVPDPCLRHLEANSVM